MIKLNPLAKKELPKEKPKIPGGLTSVSKTILPVQTSNAGFTAEDIQLIVDVWLQEMYARFKTFYSSRKQVKAVTRVQTMADRWDVDCIKKYLTELRITLLSLEGLTGKQLVEILRERLNTMIEEKSNESWSDKFLQ